MVVGVLLLFDISISSFFISLWCFAIVVIVCVCVCVCVCVWLVVVLFLLFCFCCCCLGREDYFNPKTLHQLGPKLYSFYYR